MTPGAKLYGAKCLGLLALTGAVCVLQKTFLDEPIEYLVPSILLIGGLYLGFFDPTFLDWRYENRAKQALGILIVLLSLWLARPPAPEAQIPWKPYAEQSLDQARKLGHPVIIDFFATWCGPCLELDRKVFSRRVVAEAAKRFIALRADVSDQGSAFTQEVTARYHVEVFPTVVFIGSDGNERLDLRLNGVESVASFKQRLADCP